MGSGRLGHHASARRSAVSSQIAWCGVRISAGLEPADGDDLVPGPDLDGEGAGTAEQSGVGAIVGLLQGRDKAAMMHPNQGGIEKVPRKLLCQLVALLVLARQRKNRGHPGF